MQSNASLQSANCQKIENIINCKITQQDFKKSVQTKALLQSLNCEKHHILRMNTIMTLMRNIKA